MRENKNVMLEKKSEVKDALISRRNLLVLMYKEVMSNTNLTTPLPPVVENLLQEFNDMFP